MIDEDWKDVIGYEGLYQVSNYSINKAEQYYSVYPNTFSRALNTQKGNMRKYKIRKLG